MPGEVSSSKAIAPWVNPVPELYESAPGARDGTYPGRLLDFIEPRLAKDPNFVLAGEGDPKTVQSLKLITHSVQNPRKTIIDELGYAHASLKNAADGLQGLRDIMTSTGLVKLPDTFEEFDTWAKRNGRIDAFDRLTDARRAVAGAWDYTNMDRPGRDLPRFNADGTMYEGDRVHLNEPRKVIQIPTDLTPEEELHFPARYQDVLSKSGDERTLATDARRFHVTADGALGESFDWRLDNVLARMPEDMLGSLTDQELSDIRHARAREIDNFLDEVQWNDGGNGPRGVVTPPDLDAAERALGKLKELTDLTATALPGMTIAERKEQEAAKAALEAEQRANAAKEAAELAERALQGKKLGIGIIAGAGVGLAALGGGIAALMNGDER